MFVSRTSSAGRFDGDEGPSLAIPFVLIEVPSSRASGRLDKDIVPAIFAFIARDVAKTLQHVSGTDREPSISGITLVRPSREFKYFMPQGSVIVDGFSDCAGVAHLAACSDCCLHVASEAGDEALLKSLHSLASERNESNGSILFVDSLMPYLRKSGSVAPVFEFIEKWRESKHVKAFISSVERVTELSSLEDAAAILAAKRLGTTHVTMSQRCRKGLLPSLMDTGTVDINVTRLRPSGRVLINRAVAVYHRKERTLEIVESLVTSLKSARSEVRGGPESSALEKLNRLGLTFNIGLTAKERAAREKLQLSYVHRDENIANSALELNPKELAIENVESDSDKCCEWSSDDEYYEESEDV